MNYMNSVGFSSRPEKVRIRYEKDLSNAYFSLEEKELVIGENFIGSQHSGLHEYTHHLLEVEKPGSTQIASLFIASLHEALADYYSGSFLGDPKIAQEFVKLHPDNFEPNQDSQRNLDNTKTLADLKPNADPQSVGEVWSGAFWSLRKRLGADVVDRALLTAWRTFEHRGGDQGGRYLATLTKVLADNLDIAAAEAAVAELRARGLPLQPG